MRDLPGLRLAGAGREGGVPQASAIPAATSPSADRSPHALDPHRCDEAPVWLRVARRRRRDAGRARGPGRRLSSMTGAKDHNARSGATAEQRRSDASYPPEEAALSAGSRAVSLDRRGRCMVGTSHARRAMGVDGGQGSGMGLHPSRWLACAAAVLRRLMLVALSGAAAAQGVVKNTYGDWQMRCETPAGRQERAMRARPERRGRGPAESDAPRDRRSRPPTASAGCCASWRRSASCSRPGSGCKIDQNDIGRAGLSAA